MYDNHCCQLFVILILINFNICKANNFREQNIYKKIIKKLFKLTFWNSDFYFEFKVFYSFFVYHNPFAECFTCLAGKTQKYMTVKCNCDVTKNS